MKRYKMTAFLLSLLLVMGQFVPFTNNNNQNGANSIKVRAEERDTLGLKAVIWKYDSEGKRADDDNVGDTYVTLKNTKTGETYDIKQGKEYTRIPYNEEYEVILNKDNSVLKEDYEYRPAKGETNPFVLRGYGESRDLHVRIYEVKSEEPTPTPTPQPEVEEWQFGVGVTFKPAKNNTGIGDAEPVVGAKVKLTNTETNEVIEYITEKDGKQHKLVTPGTYKMELVSVPDDIKDKVAEWPEAKTITVKNPSYDGFDLVEKVAEEPAQDTVKLGAIIWKYDSEGNRADDNIGATYITLKNIETGETYDLKPGQEMIDVPQNAKYEVIINKDESVLKGEFEYRPINAQTDPFTIKGIGGRNEVFCIYEVKSEEPTPAPTPQPEVKESNLRLNLTIATLQGKSLDVPGAKIKARNTETNEEFIFTTVEDLNNEQIVPYGKYEISLVSVPEESEVLANREYTKPEPQIIEVTGPAQYYGIALIEKSSGSQTPENPDKPVNPGKDNESEKIRLAFKLNEGTWADGSKEDKVLVVDKFSFVDIIAAPVREGYEFLYWKGSKYLPGDKYLAFEDHTFVAQWKKVAKAGSETAPEAPSQSDKSVESSKANDNKAAGNKTTKTGDTSYIAMTVGIISLVVATALVMNRKKDEK